MMNRHLSLMIKQLEAKRRNISDECFGELNFIYLPLTKTEFQNTCEEFDLLVTLPKT